MSKIQIALAILVFVLLFFPQTGCSRQRYRQQADRDANELIGTVARDQRWQLTDYSLQPNPHSRFFNPYNPDCEPMPPDDATAHRYMHYVDGKRNGNWDEKGRTNFVENPYWQQYLPKNEEGYVSLDRENAFLLAQTHSPEYQNALENLYLSALNVSFERFQFDTQFYGGSSMFYSSDGSVRDSTWKNTNRVGFQKTMATGAQATVDLANTITWQLAGPDTQAYNTILSTTFLQPFLREGGREYVLESLTRSERNLLANVRQMAFYRQGFYKTVVFGGNNVGVPSANGSPNSSSSGTNLTGGYISLLASQVRISNLQNNVISKRNSEKQFISLFEAGRVREYMQVEQARASYLESQSQLMSQVNGYNSSVEQFVASKIGLPPDLKVRIEDPLLKQFEIMSPELTVIQSDLETYFAVVRDIKQQIPDTAIDGLSLICDQLDIEIANVYADIEKLEAKMPERISDIRFLEQQTEQFEGYIDPASFSEGTFVDRVSHLRKEVPKLERDLRITARLINSVRKVPRDDLTRMLSAGRMTPDGMESLIAMQMQNILLATSMPADINERTLTDAQKDPYRYFMTQVFRKLTGDVRQLSLEQARARLDAISMTPIDITPETAIKVAAQYRLDWMNARAELVNNWRDIEIKANELSSYLNLRLDGEIGSRTSKPLALDRRNGKISVGVEWDSPLTRLAERNGYRTAQINYQRARRDYYNFVDGVNKTLRDSLRNIDNVQFDFEVQRRAVLVAISRVHLAQLAMEKPPEVGQTSESMSNTLARDLVEALNSLLDAQNKFMAIWTDHYGMRAALCLDLGIMQLDENGAWVDPGSVRETDYNQLVANHDGETMGLTLPNAPTLPGGNVAGVIESDHADVLIFPSELQQAPPVPTLFDPTEALPPNMMSQEAQPQGTALQETALQETAPPARMKMTPVETQNAFEVDENSAPVPPNRALPNATTNSSDAEESGTDKPVPQRRVPPTNVLQHLGAEGPQRLPQIEEGNLPHVTQNETLPAIHYNSRPIINHAVQTSAETSQDDSPKIISVSTSSLRAQTLTQ